MAVDAPVHCQKLGNNIYLYESPSVPPSENNDPSLIILFTWLGGATTRYVNKYVVKHRSLFPHATILLVRTAFPDMTLRSFNTLRQRLAPARDATRRILATHNHHPQSPFKGALLHIFSHGGCNLATQFMISCHQESLHLPVRAMIIDCAPGSGSFTSTYRAAAYSIPAGTLPQLTGRALLVPTAASIVTLQSLGVMASVSDLRRQLNDPTVFPTDIRRLYLYSTGDLVVDPEQVESHIADARATGCDVESVSFEDSPHCAILSRSEERYGATISNFWSSTVQDNKKTTEQAPTAPPLGSDVQKDKKATDLRSKL